MIIYWSHQANVILSLVKLTYSKGIYLLTHSWNFTVIEWNSFFSPKVLQQNSNRYLILKLNHLSFCKNLWKRSKKCVIYTLKIFYIEFGLYIAIKFVFFIVWRWKGEKSINQVMKTIALHLWYYDLKDKYDIMTKTCIL